METTTIQKRFILTGALTGIAATIIYPVIFYFQLAFKFNLMLNLAFGFSIGFTTYSIFIFNKIHRDSVCLRVGAITGILAAFTYLLKSSVFVAVSAPLEGILVQGDQSFVYGITSRLHIGIAFIWDILIAASILSLSIAFFRQPRPGKIISVAGILFSLVIIVFSIYSFPELLGDMSFTGMGAALPVWHFAVSILMLFSLKWIKVKDPGFSI